MFELLIVIGMLAILSYLAVPVSITFYRSQVLDSERGDLISILMRARHNAVLQKYDSRFGVYIDDMGGNFVSYTLYRGDAYDALNHDTDYDEVYPANSGTSISAVGSTGIQTGDINFAKLTGLTSATGTITVSHNSGPESKSLLIDSFGNAYEQ